MMIVMLIIIIIPTNILISNGDTRLISHGDTHRYPCPSVCLCLSLSVCIDGRGGMGLTEFVRALFVPASIHSLHLTLTLTLPLTLTHGNEVVFSHVPSCTRIRYKLIHHIVSIPARSAMFNNPEFSLSLSRTSSI